MAMLKHGLTEEQIEELKEVSKCRFASSLASFLREIFVETFNYMDTNNTGTITLAELGLFLFPEEDEPELEVRQFLENELNIDAMDLKISGQNAVSFPVFLTMFARKLHQIEGAGGDDAAHEEEIRFMFEWFDADNDNNITKVELQSLMTSALGEHLTEEEIEQMVSNADKDDDDQISYEEFKAIMRKQK